MVVMALALKNLLIVYFSSLTNRFYGGNNLNLTLEKNFLCHFLRGRVKKYMDLPMWDAFMKSGYIVHPILPLFSLRFCFYNR